MNSRIRRLSAYLILTKPTILLLVVVTGAAGLALEGSLNHDPFRFVLVLLLVAAAGGSANGLNQYLERDRDSLMERTRRRRPLPTAKIAPWEALAVSIGLGIVSVGTFGVWFNLLSALLVAATILFYSLFYTIYLKPRTHWNIVIGGAAGAMAPVIAWAAASGETAILPWLMFAIIFFWTPPHFWALAICLKEDYSRAGLPMLPLLVDDKETWKRILRYTVWTLLFSVAVAFMGSGLIYAAAAAILGWFFLSKVVKAAKQPTRKAAWGLFSYSIVYLLVLFVAMVVDVGVGF